MFSLQTQKDKSYFEYAVLDERMTVIHQSSNFFELLEVPKTKNFTPYTSLFGQALKDLERVKKPAPLNKQGTPLHYTLEPFPYEKKRLFFLSLVDGAYVHALQKNITLLAEQSYLVRSILDSLQDGIFIADEHGDIVYFNDAITRLAGYEKSVMVGSNLFKGLERGDYKNSCVARVIQTKMPYVTINEYSQWGVKKGENKGSDCLVSGTPIFDKQGNLKFAVSIARDISELQKIQDEMQKTQTLSMLFNRQIKSLQQQASLEVIEPNSKTMEYLFELAVQVADLDLPLLLTGETGVGKGFFAHYIHTIGARSSSPFLKINCSAIPENLLESELFGYEEGAFTGASKKGKQGFFEVAGDGTLLLDEIGDMPYHLQAKLLGVLQDKTIIPLGGNKPVQIKSRIIAATNANLEEFIKQKKFRSDLFYRLNVIQFKIPPLRDRKEDIIFFCNKFLRHFNNKHNKNINFSSDLYDKMLFYSWPGNIRELKNTVERLVVMSKNGVLREDPLLDKVADAEANTSLATTLYGGQTTGMTLKDAVAVYESDLISATITKAGSVTKAASLLGVDVSTLNRKRKKGRQIARSSQKGMTTAKYIHTSADVSSE